MRFLTSISALILAAAGAYCFAFYMNGYAGVAFALGAALMIYGVCHLICYAVGFRKGHLPESVFVDGAVSFAFGFAVVADLIPEGSISIYFGFWLMLSGFCRFTEALAVSKINPRNWFAVVPLSIINALFGFLMIIPEFLKDLDDVYCIAVAYILQAFSVAIYALYMIKRVESVKAKEAKERAAAKKQAAELARQERDRKRQLSEAEREAELEEARLAKVKDAEERAAARQARKDARRPASEKTMSFTAEETAEINALAKGEDPGAVKIDDADEAPSTEQQIEANEQPEELLTRPVFNKPVNIPTIEKEVQEEKTQDDSVKLAAKRGLVNLEEMENKIPEVEFTTPELNQPVLQSSGGEASKREFFLLELEGERVPAEDPDELSNFTPLSLEELFEDEGIKPLSDRKAAATDLKLTQTFTFDWLDTKKFNDQNL